MGKMEFNGNICIHCPSSAYRSRGGVLFELIQLIMVDISIRYYALYPKDVWISLSNFFMCEVRILLIDKLLRPQL